MWPNPSISGGAQECNMVVHVHRATPQEGVPHTQGRKGSGGIARLSLLC